MIKKRKVTYFFIEISIIVISIILNVDWQFSITCLLWSMLFLYALDDYEKRILLIAFLITFFLFLLGAYVCYQYFDYEKGVVVFDTDIMQHIYRILTVSLISIWIGFSATNQYLKKYKRTKTNFYKCSNYLSIVRNVSKISFYLLYVPYLAVILEKITYKSVTGYSGIYLNYSSSLPYLIRLMANMAPMMLFIFLAALPEKKECRIPILLYLLYLITTLGTGQRSDFVMGILLIIIYFFYRNNTLHSKEKWITKKEILWIMALAPVLVIILTVYGQVRFGEEYTIESLKEAFLDVFASQGVSVSVIGYEEVYKYNIPENRIYSLGGIIDFLKYNPISNVLFNFVEYTGQNAQRALKGNSMAHIISYFVLPFNYKLGRGLGSCYLAELFHDFSYIGIIVGNIIYGIVIRYCGQFNEQKLWVRYISLIVIQELLLAPRATADGFISGLLGLEVIGAAVCVGVISSYIYKKYSKR